MKILLLIAGSRSGSDFFHSLLDGHSQILQFPGYLNINKNFYNIINLNNPKEISQEFIVQYPHFFDSKINFCNSTLRDLSFAHVFSNKK